MKWGDTEVNKLSDDELKTALNSIDVHTSIRQDKLSNPRFVKRIGEGVIISPITPYYIELKKEIETEITKRNLI